MTRIFMKERMVVADRKHRRTILIEDHTVLIQGRGQGLQYQGEAI